MAFPARWKTSPEFVLASTKKGSKEGRHDPKAQRERMNMFKRQLAANRTKGPEELMRRVKANIAQKSAPEQPTANSFVTRSMVEALRDERLAGAGEKGEKGDKGRDQGGSVGADAGQDGGGGGGGGGKGQEKADDNEEVQISAEDWPFVYFVVALDQMPPTADDVDEYKASKSHTAKERQRIQAARKRRIQQSREQLEKARELSIDMGLRLEPLKHTSLAVAPAGLSAQHHRSPQLTPAFKKRVFQTRHPSTPVSTATATANNARGIHSRGGGEIFLNPEEQLTIEDMICRGFSQWLTDTFSNAGSLHQGARSGKEAWPSSSTTTRAKSPQQYPPHNGKGNTTTTTTNNNNNNTNSSATTANSTTTSSKVELPDILPEQLKQKMKAILPNNNSDSSFLNPASHSYYNHISDRKAKFTEGLPFIQGSGIVVIQGNNNNNNNNNNSRSKEEAAAEPEAKNQQSGGARSATEEGDGGSAKKEQEENAAASGLRDRKEVLQAPWSAPLTSRSLSIMAPRSKLFKHLPIPKIDMVSEIYDELIIKTIQSFLEKEGYSQERVTALRSNILARLSSTYPHLARHRAWKLVRQDASDTHHGHGDSGEAGEDPRSRTRLRPLHQGFFAAHSVSDLAADFSKQKQGSLVSLPHGSRNPTDQIRPRWVPVQPVHQHLYNRSTTYLQEEQERCANAMFMSVDGRHISFTPRDDLRFKTPTLPGATSDYRMAPLVVQDLASKPTKTWTHIIPSALHN